jgi:hypothetical protein
MVDVAVTEGSLQVLEAEEQSSLAQRIETLGQCVKCQQSHEASLQRCSHELKQASW